MGFLTNTTIDDVIGVQSMNQKAANSKGSPAECHNTNQRELKVYSKSEPPFVKHHETIRPMKLQMEIVGIFMIPEGSSGSLESFVFPGGFIPGSSSSDEDDKHDDSIDLDMDSQLDLDFLNHTSIEDVIGVHSNRGAEVEIMEEIQDEDDFQIDMDFLKNISIEEVIGVGGRVKNKRKRVANKKINY